MRSAESGQETPARRPRKRTRFKMPEPAAPVRGLWRAATAEERAKAHETATGLLDLWLGKATKRELAMRWQVPPLRVWQLSQMGLSGMVCGLLKQPRRRAPGAMTSPEDDPKKLRKENARLRDQLARTERLVQLLRSLPPVRESEAATAAGEKRGKAVPRGSGVGGVVMARRRSGAAGREEAGGGDDGGDGADAGAVAER